MNYLFLLLDLLFIVAAVMYFYERSYSKRLNRELDRVSKAYGELIAQTSLREADLLDDLQREREVSDNLAPIVESYVRIIDETAALLKDDKPPSLEIERAILKQYHERRTHR
jgi:hypothetical protein